MRHTPFRRLQRRAARVSLYGSLVLVVLLLVAVATLFVPALEVDLDRTWTEVDFAAEPAVQLLQAYARIDTSSETGSELRGARFLAEQLEAIGLTAHVEDLGNGHANLWAILEGESREAVVLHNHIDVYPVPSLEGWDYPPFAAQIEAPYLYGRGVFDMKSVAIAQLEALAALRRSGRVPRRSVIFLATGGEETGSELGTRWILRQHPELVERFRVVLTEGGAVEPLSRDEIKYWGIEVAQKRFATAWVCAADPETLERLRTDLSELAQWQLQLSLSPEIEELLAVYAPTRGGEPYRRLLAEPRSIVDDPGAFRQLPPFLRSFFVNEVVTFAPEEDPGGGYRMRLVFHLLPGTDFEAMRPELLPSWILHGLAVAFEEPLGTAAGSPVDHPAFRILQSALEEAHPATPVGPYFLPWSATDARFFRAAGIPTYGFSPFLIFATDTFRADGANERIGLPGYLRGVETYVRVLERLANDTA